MVVNPEKHSKLLEGELYALWKKECWLSIERERERESPKWPHYQDIVHYFGTGCHLGYKQKQWELKVQAFSSGLGEEL